MSASSTEEEALPLGAAPASASAVEGDAARRRGPPFHPVLIEVAGCMEDEVVREVTQRLRKYRNRYTPLLRCMFTLVATTVPEASLFGDGEGKTATEPWLTAPRYAVAVNRCHPLVSRFYGFAAYLKESSIESAESTTHREHHPLPWEDVSAGRRGSVHETMEVDAPTRSYRDRGVERLEDFMAYHFLPLAMTHNTPFDKREIVPSPPPFVLRHYVNEASRTASFLFLDPYNDTSPSAVLVDPRAEQLESYVADLDRFHATLTALIFTHCYVDGDAGLAAIRARYPAAHIISGLPLMPAGTTQDVTVSPLLRLRTVAIPAFSPECLLVEVYAAGILVALCTGVLWGTDACPRWDLLHWRCDERSLLSSSSSSASTSLTVLPTDRDAALESTHRVLQRYFYDPYLRPLCSNSDGVATSPAAKSTRATGGDEEGRDAEDTQRVRSDCGPETDALQRVVLLPTHGGYSSVTNQLDLHWATHLGDLARMKYARVVIDTLADTAQVFARYQKRLPPLPHPLLFDTNRVFHLRSLLASIPDTAARISCRTQLPPDMKAALAHSVDPSSGLSLSSSVQRVGGYVNVIDVREAAAYHSLHLRGAVNVPMSFPGVQYGARRAELWLQCLLVPCRPIVAICAEPAQKAEVQCRLTALSSGSLVVVLTLAEVPELTGALALASVSSSSVLPSDGNPDADAPWQEIQCACPTSLASLLGIGQPLTWVRRRSCLVRLTGYEHLTAIEPDPQRVVLDVRTPYEFKNGSHQHSVHVQLAEMCTMAVADALSTTYSKNGEQDHAGEVVTGASSGLADAYMDTLHTNALLTGLPVAGQPSSLADVVIYCAGGYRSLIAASLLQRAMEASPNVAWRALRIVDVTGGAFQIMTQRPDLWRVKDRSIICIS